MASKNGRPGILCLETIWFDEVDNPSTRHLLELLKNLSGIQYAYRDISTAEELRFHLGRWVGRKTRKKNYALSEYGILYLGFHGSPGEISVPGDLAGHGADDDEVDLDKIADYLLKDAKYDCSGCVIHFASCSVLGAPARVREFKDKVGAAGVSGYTRSVESIESWSFELMYLDLLSRRSTWNSGTLGTLSKQIMKWPKSSGLAEHLGFKIVH